jgi:CRISPR-associated protein Csd2
MAARKLIVFQHESALGNAAAHALFDRVMIGRDAGDGMRQPGDPHLDNMPPARRFADYRVEVNHDDLPKGVRIIEKI